MKTKKDFIERCRVEKYTGGGIYINAVFYDWQVIGNKSGFKWVIGGKLIPKKQLLDVAFNVIIKGEKPPWNIDVHTGELLKIPLRYGWA